MHEDAADVLRFLEPLALPCHAAVNRLVNPVARRHRITRVLFTRTRPDNAGIAGRDGEISHGGDGALFPERDKRRAGIHRFPNTAGRTGHVKRFRITRMRLYVGDPTRHVHGAD